jgi:hypothetical protein
MHGAREMLGAEDLHRVVEGDPHAERVRAGARLAPIGAADEARRWALAYRQATIDRFADDRRDGDPAFLCDGEQASMAFVIEQ